MTVTIKDSVGTQTSPPPARASQAAARVNVNPTSLAFGNQTVGVKSAAKTATLTNGTGVHGDRHRHNHQRRNRKASLNPTTAARLLLTGATCTFTVTFDPNGARGESSMTITIKDSAGTQTLTSTGTGVTGSGTVTVNPSYARVRQSNRRREVRGENLHAHERHSLRRHRPHHLHYGRHQQLRRNHLCTSSLATGASCTFTVTFDPNGASQNHHHSVNDSAGTQTLTRPAPASTNTPAATHISAQKRGSRAAHHWPPFLCAIPTSFTIRSNRARRLRPREACAVTWTLESVRDPLAVGRGLSPILAKRLVLASVNVGE